MEGLPRHTRSSFKRSTMNFRSHSLTPSCSDCQRVHVAKPPSNDIPRKIKGFFYSLVGKRTKKGKKSKREEGNQKPLEELDVRKLIRLYCKHENLYNPGHPYYGNKEFAEDCYNDMARSIPGRSGFELRSCIEELRYLFEREYKFIESARLIKGEVLMPSIPYYREFLFLVPYLCIGSNKPHAESGTSSQNRKCVTKPAPDFPSSKLNNFTGFPLSAFPGYICCSPKEMLKRTFKKDGKKQILETNQVSNVEKPDVTFSPSVEQRVNNIIARNRDSKMSFTSSHYEDEQHLKITDLTCPLRSENSPCVSECRLPHSECQVLDSKPPTTSKPQESMKPAGESFTPVKSNKNNSESFQKKNSGLAEQEKYAKRSASLPIDSVPSIPSKQTERFISVTESFAAVEQEKFMKAHPPNSAGSSFQASSERQMGTSDPNKKPCPCSLQEKRKEAAPEDKRDNPSVAKYPNFKQVQMLCDMIRTELTAAPDFIYFDAKWRIIEILREVHKRQLVHLKASPQKNALKQQLDKLKIQHQPNKPNKNSPAKPAVSKICDHMKGSHCPYCCHNH